MFNQLSSNKLALLLPIISLFLSAFSPVFDENKLQFDEGIHLRSTTIAYLIPESTEARVTVELDDFEAEINAEGLRVRLLSPDGVQTEQILKAGDSRGFSEALSLKGQMYTLLVEEMNNGVDLAYTLKTENAKLVISGDLYIVDPVVLYFKDDRVTFTAEYFHDSLEMAQMNLFRDGVLLQEFELGLENWEQLSYSTNENRAMGYSVSVPAHTRILFTGSQHFFSLSIEDYFSPIEIVYADQLDQLNMDKLVWLIGLFVLPTIVLVIFNNRIFVGLGLVFQAVLFGMLILNSQVNLDVMVPEIPALENMAGVEFISELDRSGFANSDLIIVPLDVFETRPPDFYPGEKLIVVIERVNSNPLFWENIRELSERASLPIPDWGYLVIVLIETKFLIEIGKRKLAGN